MVKSGNNYKLFFHAFYWLDVLLSAESMLGNPLKITSKDIKILSYLINKKLKIKNKSELTLDSYVINNFDHYCNSKKQINISIKYLDSKSDRSYFAKLGHLLINNKQIIDYNNDKNYQLHMDQISIYYLF